MLKTIIKKDLYKDSVALMILNNQINAHEAVNIASIMMASPANKEMFDGNGLLTDDVKAAGANDVAIVLDLKDESALEEIIKIIDQGLDSTGSSGSSASSEVDNLEEAIEQMSDANLALISVPGIYAYSVAKKCLDHDLNVMIFSDNVSLEEEKKLKQISAEKNLLVMGPDCGTSIIQGAPLAFANKVKRGKIGIVGASGTGLQEVISVLDARGLGITQAIGTGGRDLHEEVGAVTFLQGLQTLMEDDETEVILALSKPPAPTIKQKVHQYLLQSTKPVAALFLGDIPECHYENYYRADTLEELALLGETLLLGSELPKLSSPQVQGEIAGKIRGLYCGGTLASEAAILIQRALGDEFEAKHEDGYMLSHDGFEIIDLGDDKYTQGKPHPMIDPTARNPYILHAADDKECKVILFDVVIGFGSNADPAGELVNTLVKVKEKRPDIELVATICGTSEDYQDLCSQQHTLETAGVKTFRSNKQAVDYALGKVGLTVPYTERHVEAKPILEKSIERVEAPKILSEQLKVINIGLPGFAEVLNNTQVPTVQYNFRPIAGGDKELMEILEFLENWRA